VNKLDSKISNHTSKLFFLLPFIFALLFEGLSKWLFSMLYRDEILVDPLATLPSASDWILRSLLWPRIWLRAAVCAMIYFWLFKRLWPMIEKQVLLFKGLIWLLLQLLILILYQFLLYRPFSIDKLKLFQPELICFSLTILIYYTPMAFGLAWLQTHLQSKNNQTTLM